MIRLRVLYYRPGSECYSVISLASHTLMTMQFKGSNKLQWANVSVHWCQYETDWQVKEVDGEETNFDWQNDNDFSSNSDEFRLWSYESDSNCWTLELYSRRTLFALCDDNGDSNNVFISITDTPQWYDFTTVIIAYWITSNRYDCVLLLWSSCLCVVFYFITLVISLLKSSSFS